MPDPDTDLETPIPDAVEQEQGLTVGDDTPARDLEAPDADAAEQAAEVPPAEDSVGGTSSVEVDEADAAEQGRVVDYDDDEYR